jgi:two-component system, cell cycle sensor histidine kinase PleC
MTSSIDRNPSTAESEKKLLSERLEKMSHDFRTPLNIIIGFSELMLEEVPGKINDEQRHSLNDIHDSGQRLLTLLNDSLSQFLVPQKL